jgi:nitrite reductase/ring-hydroxylating ferredoxin subunit
LSGTARQRLLCAVAEVPPGTVRQVHLLEEDRLLAVYNLDGEYFLTDDLCTHAMANLSGGEIEDGRVICPLHGGAFDIRTGAAVLEPCTEPLRTYRVAEREGNLYGEVDE